MSAVSSSVAVVGAYVVQIVGNVVIGVNSNNTSVSAQTYLQPDGVTFAVWGVIYLLLLVFVGFQLKQGLTGADPQWLNLRTRGLAALSFLLNPLWLYLNNVEAWWLSAFELILYAATLGFLYHSLKVDYGEPQHVGAPWGIQVGVFAGFSANLAWAVVASAVNFTNSALYVELGINTGPTYAVCIIAVVTVLASVVTFCRCDVPYAAVSAWALSGIARMQTNGSPRFHRPLSREVVTAAHTGIGVVVLALLAGMAYRMVKNSSKYAPVVAAEEPLLETELGATPVEVGWVEGAPPPPTSAATKLVI